MAYDLEPNVFGTNHPKAVAKVVDDAEQLLASYDFPAEHWVHLKTTNPIESIFATVRLRTTVTKGPGSAPPGSRWCSSSSGRPSDTGATSAEGTWSRLCALVQNSRKSVHPVSRRGRNQGRRVDNQDMPIHNP